MSIKKGPISDIVQHDWQQRQALHKGQSQPISTSPTLPPLSPNQELKLLINAMAQENKRIATPAYLTQPMLDALKLIARHKGLSTASLMRQVLVDFIKNTNL